jgi:undecaprenyl-diphosphatase
MHLIAASTPAIYHMSFFQAVVIGLTQGVFELFPLSSLGHTVLIPSWIGGNWATLVRQESLSESPYLAFVVGLHLANAIALLVFYAREWYRVIKGFFVSLARRRVESDSERLAWLIVIATIPVGALGLALEHAFRTLFAKPLAAAFFLCANGAILGAGEWYRQRSQARLASAAATTATTPALGALGALGAHPQPGTEEVANLGGGTIGQVGTGGVAFALLRFRNEKFVAMDQDAEHQLAASISIWSAFWIGASQALALLAGISREGVAMVGGLYRGLSNENAMRFAFLLSTPVIFAAGALKVPDLLGHLGDGIRGQVLAGSGVAVVASFVAVAFLTRYFKTRTLVPFAVYSGLFGLASIVRFGLF